MKPKSWTPELLRIGKPGVQGFGFIEVEDDEAERVIEAMNGRSMGGRELIVNEAKPRPNEAGLT